MQKLIAEIRAMWDEWDGRDGVIDDEIDFFSFYNGFMAPYFGCYRCDETRKALKCIDMDEDGKVDWKEFSVYLKWAANQYPGTMTADELLNIAFRKGIVPAMQDEILKELPEQDYNEEEDPEKDFFKEYDLHDESDDEGQKEP